MIEDGMMRLYNISNERVTKVINGTRVSIPAHGSANVSERKGRVMLECYPGQLTEDSNYDKHQYGEDEFAAIDALDVDALRGICRVLMSGEKPDFASALRDMENRQAKSVPNKKS